MMKQYVENEVHHPMTLFMNRRAQKMDEWMAGSAPPCDPTATGGSREWMGMDHMNQCILYLGNFFIPHTHYFTQPF